MTLSYFGLLLWSAIALIILAAFYVYASQFQWYIGWATPFDPRPWIFDYLSSYVVSPAYSNDATAGEDSGLSSFTAAQTATLTQIIYFTIIMTYLWVSSTTTQGPNPLLNASSKAMNPANKEILKSWKLEVKQQLVHAITVAQNKRRQKQNDAKQ